jgi:glycerol uptake facilitator-like aquaporin
MLTQPAGVGSTAPFVVGNLLKIEGLSSVLQIGLAYAVGVVFAITACSSTSGGHFSPGITISMTIFKGFPPLKAVRYIFAQILGAYLASMLVYYQWNRLINEAELAANKLSPTPDAFQNLLFSPQGPAGIFGLYLLPGQAIGNAFVNEFTNCVVLTLIIWAALDPSNYMIPPTLAPWLIGLAYGAAVWGFAIPGIALNTARDLGARLWVMTIWGPVWGSRAWGGSYAAITAFTNIPATMVGVILYELFLMDSDRVVSHFDLDYLRHIAGHRRVDGQHGPATPIKEVDSEAASQGSEKL